MRADWWWMWMATSFSRILWLVRFRPRSYQSEFPNFTSRLCNTLASGQLQKLESAVLRDWESATLAPWTLRHLTSWHLEAYDRNILSFWYLRLFDCRGIRFLTIWNSQIMGFKEIENSITRILKSRDDAILTIWNLDMRRTLNIDFSRTVQWKLMNLEERNAMEYWNHRLPKSRGWVVQEFISRIREIVGARNRRNNNPKFTGDWNPWIQRSWVLETQESRYPGTSNFPKLKLVDIAIMKHWDTDYLELQNLELEKCRNQEIGKSFTFSKPKSQTTEILKSWDTKVLKFPNRISFVMPEYRYLEISNSSHTQNEKSCLFR